MILIKYPTQSFMTEKKIYHDIKDSKSAFSCLILIYKKKKKDPALYILERKVLEKKEQESSIKPLGKTTMVLQLFVLVCI